MHPVLTWYCISVCDEPPSPVNGSLSFSEDRLTVTFICDIRFTLRGTNVLECKPDGGLWSDVFPTCGKYNL